VPDLQVTLGGQSFLFSLHLHAPMPLQPSVPDPPLAVDPEPLHNRAGGPTRVRPLLLCPGFVVERVPRSDVALAPFRGEVLVPRRTL